MAAPTEEIRLVLEGAGLAPPVEVKGGSGEPTGLPDDCPVEPLGVDHDWVFYMDFNRQFRAVRVEKHSRLMMLSLYGAAGKPVLWRHWPRVNKDGETVGWRPEALQEALIAHASSLGVWDVYGRLRGPGAWLGADGELIYHCGDCLVIGGRASELGAEPLVQMIAPGRQGYFVYPTGAAGPRPSNVSGAGQNGAGAQVMRLFSNWNWLRGDVDSLLALGWCCAAMVGGALKWRPLIWITGDRATGKSWLHALIHDLFDKSIISVSDTSAAGLWQKLQHASLPIAIDEIEAEADNRRVLAVMTLARAAASGGMTLRGSADHQYAAFECRSCFFFSSVLIPPMGAQDRSRVAILELGSLDTGAGLPELIRPTAREMAELGAQLRRRLMDAWHEFPQRLNTWRQALAVVGHDGRGADLFGVLLALADLVLHDAPPSGDELVAWTQRLRAADIAARGDDAPDHVRCLEYLLS